MNDTDPVYGWETFKGLKKLSDDEIVAAWKTCEGQPDMREAIAYEIGLRKAMGYWRKPA